MAHFPTLCVTTGKIQIRTGASPENFHSPVCRRFMLISVMIEQMDLVAGRADYWDHGSIFLGCLTPIE